MQIPTFYFNAALFLLGVLVLMMGSRSGGQRAGPAGWLAGLLIAAQTTGGALGSMIAPA